MKHALLALTLPVLLAAAPAPLPAFEAGPAAPGFLPRTTPEAAGIAPARLQALLAAAQEGGSDALIVLRDGKVLAERYFHGEPGRSLPCMSVSKAVASLAIGMLIDDGKIASVDVPMSTYLPAWAADPRKSRVTLRHVLTHTSGVGKQMMGTDVYRTPDWVAFARDLPANAEPGTKWTYNNAVMMLMAEVVLQASGQQLDAFLDARLFKPLGATARWAHDKQGHPDVFGGLGLAPRDLAKVGLLVQQGGSWEGKRLISRDWLLAASTPQDTRWDHQGLGFMIGYPIMWGEVTPASRERLRARGQASLADKLAPFDGRRFRVRDGDWATALRTVATGAEVGVLEALRRGSGFSVLEYKQDYDRRTMRHDGWLGQLLVIDPTERLVGVRFYARRGDSMESPELWPIEDALNALAKP